MTMSFLLNEFKSDFAYIFAILMFVNRAFPFNSAIYQRNHFNILI